MYQSNTKNGSKQNATNKGGQTTNRPTYKSTKSQYKTVQILCSGIDSLVLAVDVFWKDLSFLNLLKNYKEFAGKKESDVAIPFTFREKKYYFNIKQIGAPRFEYIIHNADYLLKIGNWQKPKNIPSIMITIRSEALWLNGYQTAIIFILRFIRNFGGMVQEIKISRLDLCVDALFPEKNWKLNIINYSKCKAPLINTWLRHKKLETIQFGKGKLVGRLYDKPKEIEVKKKKFWFYTDIWKINEVPDGYKIIRAEFELKREAIKELGLKKLGHLNRLSHNAWAYCSKKWLKFQDKPKERSEYRKTLPWWIKYQNGYNLKRNCKPLIRCKDSNPDGKDLVCQAFGIFSALTALKAESLEHPAQFDLNIKNSINLYEENLKKLKKNDAEFYEKVVNKRSKYQSLHDKYSEALKERKKLGFL